MTVHMSGAGNTFLLVDDRSSTDLISELTAESVSRLIQTNERADGRAIEGLLRIRSIDSRGVSAEFYNPDGSRGMFCGNGARCVIRYAIDNGAAAQGPLTLTFNGAVYTARAHNDGTISVLLPPPTQLRYFPTGTLDSVDVPVWYANVNSDHVVIDAPQDAGNPLVACLRHHPEFPRGTNVNMLGTSDDGTLHLATFERGVEAITQACGTGAVSASLSMWMRAPSVHVYRIIPPSGRMIEVTINADGGQIQSIELRGDATYDNA
jgi:diaminopimelate epimerase